MHTLKPNRISAKKSCFSDWSTAGNLLSQESLSDWQNRYSANWKGTRLNFAQLLYKFPSAIMVVILKLSSPFFFHHKKRCSIICANFNISPLETINCFHNTELFKLGGGGAAISKGGKVTYEHGNPLPSERNGFFWT